MTRNPVPDLLHRHVPTPHKLAANGIAIETNDADMLNELQSISGSDPRLASKVYIRIIREISGPAGTPNGLRILRVGPLCLVLVGNGTMIMADSEQRCVFAFVTPDVTNNYFAQVCLPLALRCIQDSRSNSLHLQDIALGGNDLVQNRVDKESDEQARDQTGDDYDRERPLRIRTNPSGQRGR